MTKDIQCILKVQLNTKSSPPTRGSELKLSVVLTADFQATLVKAKNFLACANIPDNWHNPNEHTLGQLKYSSVLTLIPQLRPRIMFSSVWITEHLDISNARTFSFYVDGGEESKGDKIFPRSMHCTDFQPLAAMSKTKPLHKPGQDKSIKLTPYIESLHCMVA